MRYRILILLAFAFSSCNPVTERMEGFAVHGIDVSHHQAQIQWDTVAAQQVDFAFVKATEGYTLVDSMYCYNWQEMNRVGIKRGAYHFFRPQVPVYWQVQNFLQQVQLVPGDLPPVLDVEVADGLEKDHLVFAIQTWLSQIEMAYGIRPIIYSNYNFYQEYLATAFANYPLWIARYRRSVPGLASEQKWHFWQYGNRGQLQGVEGDVDFNVFNGSPEELDRLCLGPKLLLSQLD